MLFSTQLLTLATLLSTLSSGLPVDTLQAREIIPRAKSYAVINVDGGLSTEAPPPPVTVIKATKTIEVVNPGVTVTQEVTTVVTQPAPAPATTSSCLESTSSSPTSSPSSTSAFTSSISTISSSTPSPIIVTVTVPEDSGSTQYYDDGMWHTKYPIKTFEAAAATTIFAASPSLPTSFISSSVISTSITLPVLESPRLWYNQTST